MVSYFKVVIAIDAVILEILEHVQHAEILTVSNRVHYGYAKCQHNMATSLLNYHPRPQYN